MLAARVEEVFLETKSEKAALEKVLFGGQKRWCGRPFFKRFFSFFMIFDVFDIS